MMTLPTLDRSRLKKTGKVVASQVWRIPGLRVPELEFWSTEYRRLNQRRQEHLATLGLPLAERSVLEVGAGVGDHTSFFLDRGCAMIVTDGRPEHVRRLRRRFPKAQARVLDLDDPDPDFRHTVEVVYCYGVLYHLRHPARALEYLRRHCSAMLLLETCVSFGDTEELHPCDERTYLASQSLSGQGCRPTRPWVYRELARHFEFVYLPVTQPWHEQFPIDWTSAGRDDREGLSRAIFVASTEPIESAGLASEIPAVQTRGPS